MIKFLWRTNNRLTIGLGLSRRNTELLLEGKPIITNGEELSPDLHFDIAIFAGETEDSMQKELEEVTGHPLPIIDFRKKENQH